MAVLDSRHIAVFGGVTSHNPPSLPPSLPSPLPRYGHTMTVLDSRHIAVFGGVTQQGHQVVAYDEMHILVVRSREGGREDFCMM